MGRFLKLAIAAFTMTAVVDTTVSAHAFLDHAVPGVGMTVTGSPGELRFYFTQSVVTAFSRVQVVSDSGASIPCGKPVNDPSDPSVITVRLGHSAQARNLYGKLAHPLGRHPHDLGHVQIHGLLNRPDPRRRI
jgi:copper resistance protein C